MTARKISCCLLTLAALALVPAVHAQTEPPLQSGDPMDTYIWLNQELPGLSEPACQEAHAAASSQDVAPVPGSNASASHRSEYDYFTEGGRCQAMRDDVLRTGLSVVPFPSVPETCATVRGIDTCVAVGHWQCDVGFLTYYNYVNSCMGGLNPDNPQGPY